MNAAQVHFKTKRPTQHQCDLLYNALYRGTAEVVDVSPNIFPRWTIRPLHGLTMQEAIDSAELIRLMQRQELYR